MATKYMKEDGSLDVERIGKLPQNEYSYVICHLTHEQVKEYCSKLPLKESKGVKTTFKVEDAKVYLKQIGAVDARVAINNLRKHD